MSTPKKLISFHANFVKEDGPRVTGETRLQFDVPELYEQEIEGIRRILKNKNLLVVIYDVEEIEQFNNKEYPEANIN